MRGNRVGIILLVVPVLVSALQAEVIAWGADYFGQDHELDNLVNVVGIATGTGQSFFILGDGTVVAFGMNDYGQTDVPANLDGVIQVAAGEVHAIALRTDGNVVSDRKINFSRSVRKVESPLNSSDRKFNFSRSVTLRSYLQQRS